MADDKLNVNPALQQDGDDTVTRKTIKLRPAMVAGATAAKPVEPAPAAAPAAEDSGEKTIRIQRPNKPANKPIGPAVVAAAPIGAKTAPAADAVQAAPKLQPLQKADEPSAIEPAGTSLEGIPVAAADGDIFAIPSKIYLGIALAALILMIYSTLLITVQFLDITQGQDTAAKVSFMVPGGNKAK